MTSSPERSNSLCHQIVPKLNHVKSLINKAYDLFKIPTSLAKEKDTKKKIQTAIRFLQKQQPKITGFDEALVGRLIERITIEEGRIKVQFKSGVEIEDCAEDF